MTQPTLSEALQRVARRFAERLPDRLDRLEAEAGALSVESPQDKFVELERALHDIAGTAPTLGYYALGQAARDVERRVGDLRLLVEPRSVERLAMLAGAVQALRETTGQRAN